MTFAGAAIYIGRTGQIAPIYPSSSRPDRHTSPDQLTVCCVTEDDTVNSTASFLNRVPARYFDRRTATATPRSLVPTALTMGELINLRKARKDAKRQADSERAAANRLVHGRTKEQRAQDTASAERARRHLDAHKIDTGED